MISVMLRQPAVRISHHAEALWLAPSWHARGIEYQNPAGCFEAVWRESDPELGRPGLWLPPRADTWHGVHRVIDEDGYCRDDDEYWGLGVDVQSGVVGLGPVYRVMEGYELAWAWLHGTCVRLEARRNVDPTTIIACVYDGAGEDIPL